MDEIISLLVGGFFTVFQLPNVIAMIFGVALGTIFGALPGLSATTGMALLLPVAYNLNLNTGLLMLAGIYAGALYGGSVSAILLGIPGTAAALPTTFDGFPMSKNGKASDALLYGLYGSAFGGVASALVLMFLTPPISAMALKFGPPEMFALSLWGISVVSSVVGDNWVKGILASIFGLIVSTVGADPVNGVARFTFGNYYLISGFALVPLILGTLAVPRVFDMVENFNKEGKYFKASYAKKYYFKPKEILVHTLLMIRSSIIGTIVGIAPAAGPTIAAFMSYNTAKQASKSPETFGKGNPEGILAAETANNAATGGSLVLALSLGIPGSAAAAVLMSALIMRGFQPGPMLLENNSDLVYTFFVGFLVVNILVFVIGHFFVQAGPYVLKTPEKILAPIIMVICVVGAYSESQTMFAVYVTLISSFIAYVLTKMDFPVSPFLLALILGNMMEANLWTSYTITYGNLWLVFKRPVFLIILTLAIVTFCTPALKSVLRKKKLKISGID